MFTSAYIQSANIQLAKEVTDLRPVTMGPKSALSLVGETARFHGEGFEYREAEGMSGMLHSPTLPKWYLLGFNTN